MTEAGLTDDDLDRVLADVVARGDGILARRRRRNAVLSGLGVVVLLAGGFGMLRSLADDDRVVVGPAGSGGAITTVPAPKPLEPEGFSRTTTTDAAGDEIVTLTNETPVPPVPTTTASSVDGVGVGVDIDSAASVLRTASIVRSAVSGSRVHLEFECLRNEHDRIDTLRYRRVEDAIAFDATISNVSVDGVPCTGGAGASIDVDVTDGGFSGTPLVTAEQLGG